VLPVVGHEDSIADDTLDQTLELQSRWFGDTRNIVEHRHPNGSRVTTVRSGATSCARRFTR